MATTCFKASDILVSYSMSSHFSLACKWQKAAGSWWEARMTHPWKGQSIAKKASSLSLPSFPPHTTSTARQSRQFPSKGKIWRNAIRFQLSCNLFKGFYSRCWCFFRSPSTDNRKSCSAHYFSGVQKRRQRRRFAQNTLDIPKRINCTTMSTTWTTKNQQRDMKFPLWPDVWD